MRQKFSSQHLGLNTKRRFVIHSVVHYEIENGNKGHETCCTNVRFMRFKEQEPTHTSTNKQLIFFMA